jgi:diacylglycerol kinase family enzyme
MQLPSHSRTTARAAALVAISAMGAVLGIVLWAAARETGAFMGAFIFVFIFAFSGWFVLTRRRLWRVLGALGMFVGLSGLAGFVQHQFLLLGMLIASIGLFGLFARYAVRHHPEVASSTSRHRRTRGMARRGVLIINPRSGNGKAERFQLPDEARRRGIEPFVLGAGDDLTELAEHAVEGGADVIGMAGGDGSQALVATVAMRHDVAHVCIPAGTRNNFAADLGLDRNDVLAALDAFTDGVERRIDLAAVNERVYVNNASLGLYAQVVQSDAYRAAKLRTWRRLLPRLLGPSADRCELAFEGPDGRDMAGTALLIVSNNPYQLRRLGGVGTRHRLDSGRLGIVATRMRKATDLAQLMTLGAAGQAKRFRGLRQWSAPAFEVDCDGPVAVGLDGEALTLVPPLRFVSLPGALRVRTPRHSSGLSPAAGAVTLTRRDLRRLLSIAAGRPLAPRL